MKLALWLVFVLLAAFWTGLIALAEQMSEWLLGATASGQVTDLASLAAQWPLPAWLGVWVDTAWLQAVQASALGLVQWLGQWLPSTSSWMGWLSPLIWTVWAVGLAALLVFAVAGHWLLGRKMLHTLKRTPA